MGDDVVEVALREQHDRARAVLPGLDGVHDYREPVAVYHGQDVQPAHGLLAAVHALQVHGRDRVGHPQAHGVVAHYRAAQPHDDGLGTPLDSGHVNTIRRMGDIHFNVRVAGSRCYLPG